MFLFFKIVSVIRAAYKALRAAAGIMIVTHATYKWVESKRKPA
jgi:hypothetical protein